jgi:hypothetical protein
MRTVLKPDLGKLVYLAIGVFLVPMVMGRLGGR